MLEKYERVEYKHDNSMFSIGRSFRKRFRKIRCEVSIHKKTRLILFDMMQLFFVLSKHKFNAVHSMFGFKSGGFVLAAKMAKTKVYVSLHSTGPETFKKIKEKNILNKILSLRFKLHKYITKKLATKIIGHSKSNLDANYPGWRVSSR